MSYNRVEIFVNTKLIPKTDQFIYCCAGQYTENTEQKLREFQKLGSVPNIKNIYFYIASLIFFKRKAILLN